MKKTYRTQSPEGELVFDVHFYKSGEWTAQCREHSGIITGGMNAKGNEISSMIFDAVCVVFNR